MLVAPAVAFIPGIISSETTATLRYGAWAYHMSEPLRSSLAFTLSDSLRPGAVGVTIGYLSPACKGCEAWAVTSVEWERPMTSLFRVRIGAGLGRMTHGNGSAASLSVALPIQWQGEGVAFLVNPAAVFAGQETDRSHSRAVRPGLGAVLQFQGDRLVGHAGLQGILLRGTGLTFGGGIGRRL